MDNSTDNQSSTSENGGKRYLTFWSATLLLIVFYVLAVGVFWWLENCEFLLQCKTTQDISNLEISGDVIKKNEMVAILTAQLVKKQIDILLTIGSVYAARKDFVQFVQQNKWQDAINLASGMLKEAPPNSIDRIGLLDIAGTLQGNIPEDRGFWGQNFAFRDWYRGVTTNFKPYVSEVFERTAEPNFNVVILVFPIFNNKETPIGFMTMQIKTDIFLGWLNEIKFGNSGLSFIIDQSGHIVAHPEIPPQGAIIDFSSKTEVQKVISGQSGTEITISSKNKRTLVSYEPIGDIHWGVITRIELDEVINSGLIKVSSVANQGGFLKKLLGR